MPKIFLSVILWAIGTSLVMAASLDDAQTRKIGGNFSHPWGISLIDDQTALVTERDGRLTRLDLVSGDRINIKNVPAVFDKRQGGLLDVLVHGPDVYFCYSRPVDNGAATALAKARLGEDELVDLQVIYTSNLVSRSGVHFGCRLVISEGGIFITHGDRGMRDTAQDPDLHGGAVIRVDLDDGIVSIFTKGNRNPQGMAIHPETGAIWVNEHGPRGGDEVNILAEGANYGWPIVSHGREYSGGAVGDGLKTKEGYQDPVWVWVPSIAPSGMAFYEGDMFPELNGDLLVPSLKFRSLYHVELEGGTPVRETSYLRGKLGRLRDVEVLSDGSILLLSDESQGGVYRIWR
jgi:glucose/arabinose dehydrogenase